jgi:ubiquinone biosynthesis protein
MDCKPYLLPRGLATSPVAVTHAVTGFIFSHAKTCSSAIRVDAVLMRSWRFIQLFRMIFGPVEKLDPKKIESMGLLAVKIAQMYAIRADLLGPEKTAKLNCFYEEATPMASGEFLAEVKREAPSAFWEALDHLEEKPLAVASLGQVHRGRLKDGSEIVVKILRKDHAADFERDVAAVKLLAKTSLFFYPPLQRLADPIGTLETIRRTTVTEMDLLAEDRGTEELRHWRDAKVEDLPHLRLLDFPKIYREFSTRHILVSQFVQAPTVRKLLKEKSFTYENLLLLFRIHGYFLFYQGKFHGDFHPGNVFYDGQKFWFIDNANVETVPTEFSRGLLDFMVALGEKRYDDAARAIEALSVKPLPKPEAFRRKFAELYAGFGNKPVGEESLTMQMMNTIRMAVEEGLQFPEGAFPIIKSLMYLDGMAISCAPDKFLLEDVATYAKDFR